MNPLNVDHIVPVSEKEDHREENLQALCAECNRKKGTIGIIDFCIHETKSLRPLPFQWMALPDAISDHYVWERYSDVQSTCIMVCGAVKSVQIGVFEGPTVDHRTVRGQSPRLDTSEHGCLGETNKKGLFFRHDAGPKRVDCFLLRRERRKASSGTARKAHSASRGKARVRARTWFLHPTKTIVFAAISQGISGG